MTTGYSGWVQSRSLIIESGVGTCLAEDVNQLCTYVHTYVHTYLL